MKDVKMTLLISNDAINCKNNIFLIFYSFERKKNEINNLSVLFL